MSDRSEDVSTSNTLVRPSRINFGSGISFKNGMNHGIPSSYGQTIVSPTSYKCYKLDSFPDGVK